MKTVLLNFQYKIDIAYILYTYNNQFVSCNNKFKKFMRGFICFKIKYLDIIAC